MDATRRYGTGSTASRLITGTLDLHREAERRFARFKGHEDALLFSSGYMANLAVLTTLAGPGDLILQDKLNHASLIDAARASGATVRTYPHHDLVKLERLLDRADPAAVKLVVTDGVFSMDGDVCDLPALVSLCETYDAALVVDEAHATGVLGEAGRGLAASLGLSERVTVTVSTASKALGSIGGMVTASSPIIEALVNGARSFIYTTAVPPSQPAALLAAIDLLEREPERVVRLREICRKVHGAATPIVPLVTGNVDAAMQLAARLEARGILALPIRPPTVPPGTSRVRLALRGDLTDDEVEHVKAAIRK